MYWFNNCLARVFRSTEIDDLVFGPVFVAGTPTIGDMDFDGNIDFDDISGFMLALTNESEYFGIYGVRAEIHGDTDRSGFHDFDDIDGFAAIMSNDAPDSALRAVPEPSTFLAVLDVWCVGIPPTSVARSYRWRIEFAIQCMNASRTG